jgi:hypothetical protein
MLEELLLQRMQRPRHGHALDGLDLLASASAASIRQEQTRRSSRMIEQAPQSPVPQPSLAPVSRAIRAGRRACCLIGLAEELLRLAVDRGGNVNSWP